MKNKMVLICMLTVSFSLETLNAQTATLMNEPPGEALSARDTLHLQSDELRLVVVNNESYGNEAGGTFHRAGYNGISELYIRNGKEENIFRQSGAAMNYEFLFSGDQTSFDWNIFEPRRAPMELSRLSPHKVKLHQARTENWPLQSNIFFELSGNRVDMIYEGVPLEDYWAKHGYIGLFFATYIREPEHRGIHFIGRSRSESGDDRGRWIYSLPGEHGADANHRPAGSDWDPEFDEGFPVRLAAGISDYEYIYPFYYGTTGEYVIIMMFERTDKNSELRLAQSPNAGSPGGVHPAWDFLFYQKNYTVNEAFNFRAAMVVKKYVGKEDVIEQYEQWSGEEVDF